MKKLSAILFAQFCCVVAAHAFTSSLYDSLETKKKEKAHTLRLITRLNSLGLFAITGRKVSNNPAFDFNFYYDRKEFGFQFFKAFDLYNRHTDNNFSLALLYHQFKFGTRWTFTPGGGFVIDQTKKVLANKGSDAALIITTAFKINPYLLLDQTIAVPNMIIESRNRDWINRIRLLYSKNHLDMVATVWHNNNVFDHNEYFTTGLNVTYARIPITDHILLNTGITAMYMPYSSNEEKYPKKNGLVFTLATVLH